MFFNNSFIIVIEGDINTATQNDVSLSCVVVPVYRKHRSRLQSIQKSLCLGIKAFMHVVIHYETLACFGLLSNLI